MRTYSIEGFKQPANTSIVEQYWRTEPDGTRARVAIITAHNVTKQFTLFVNRGGLFAKEAVSTVSPKFKQINALYPEVAEWQNKTQ